MSEITKLDLIQLKKKWEELQKLKNVFAYSLNVQKWKYLPGDFDFYAEFNPERTNLRRPPQTITSLNPKYINEQFSFNKVNEQEYLQIIVFNDMEITFLINKSPLTKYHALICPDLRTRLPQRLTLGSLHFSIKLMMHLHVNDKAFRIGYNSPGALASVNHLHLHLLYIEKQLYIEKATLQRLRSDYVYRLSENMPTEALCWLIGINEIETVLEKKLAEIHDFVLWMCENNRPHNLFITQDCSHQCTNFIKVFIFARENYCYIKDVKSFNIGFCELAGYVPVGNIELYESLTEKAVIKKICNETGSVYQDIYSFIVEYKKELMKT